LAAAGYIAPIYAALFNVICSLAVIFNSARLVRAGEQIEHEEAEALAKRTGRQQAVARPTQHSAPQPA
jgi:cation transport ATPase